MSGYRCRLPFVDRGVAKDHATRLDVIEWSNFHRLEWSLSPVLPLHFTIDRLDALPLTKQDRAIFGKACVVSSQEREAAIGGEEQRAIRRLGVGGKS